VIDDFVGVLGGEQGWGDEEGGKGRGCEGVGEETGERVILHGRSEWNSAGLRIAFRDGGSAPAMQGRIEGGWISLLVDLALLVDSEWDG
jgi:hypothetical protein